MSIADAPTLADGLRELVKERARLIGRMQAIDDILTDARKVVQGLEGIGQIADHPVQSAADAVVSCEGFEAADGHHTCAKKLSWSVGVRSPSRKRCPACAGEQHKLTVKKSRSKAGRSDGQKAGALVRRSGGVTPSRSDREFALFVQQHPGSSAEQIREGLNTSSSIVKRKLQLLQKHGLVHVVGRAGSARWFHGPRRESETEPDQVRVWSGRDGMPVTKSSQSVGSSLSPSSLSKAGH